MQMTVREGGYSVDVPLTLVGDFQAPDRMEGTITISMLGFTVEMEVISIGDAAYGTNPETGEWEFGFEVASEWLPSNYTSIRQTEVANLEYIGEETLNGTPVHHLTGTASSQAFGGFFSGMEGSLQVEFWIGVEDGRLNQSAVQGDVLLTDSSGLPFGEAAGGTANIAMTIHFSEFGKSVVIEAPELTIAFSSVAFSPDGQTLASASVDGTVQTWDVGDLDSPPTVLFGHEGVVFCVAFSPDEQTLASAGGDGTIRLWDTTDPSVAPTVLTGHTDWVRSLAFSPDGQLLVSASDDLTVRLWDVTEPRAAPIVLTGHTDWVKSVAFSPDGELVASASDDMTIRLWSARDPSTNPVVLSGHTDWVRSVAFSPDGRALASASDDLTVHLWNVADPAADPVVISGHGDWVFAVAFSADGGTIASAGGDATVYLWDADDPSAELAVLTGHRGPILSVAFSPDGQTLASASEDGTVHVWDLTAPNPSADPVILTVHR